MINDEEKSIPENNENFKIWQKMLKRLKVMKLCKIERLKVKVMNNETKYDTKYYREKKERKINTSAAKVG